jgi:hypothetical protein
VFRVRVHDAHDLIGDGTIRLVVVQRQRMEARIAYKQRRSTQLAASRLCT